MNNPEIEKLNEELRADFDEYSPTYAEAQNLYSLKNYIDKRFDLLEEKIMLEFKMRTS